jgi:hypothetical protein
MEVEELPPLRPIEAAPISLEGINFTALQNKEPDELPPPEEENEPDDSVTKKRSREPESDDEQEPLKRTKLARRELLFILGQCRQRETFRKAYREIVGKRKVHKMSDEDLATAIEEIKFEVGATNSSIINDWTMKTVCAGVERMAVEIFALKCEGMAAMSIKDPEFLAIWDELSLEYMHLCTINPKWKALMYFAKTTYLTHHMNKKLEEMKNKIDSHPPMPPIAVEALVKNMESTVNAHATNEEQRKMLTEVEASYTGDGEYYPEEDLEDLEAEESSCSENSGSEAEEEK